MPWDQLFASFDTMTTEKTAGSFSISSSAPRKAATNSGLCLFSPLVRVMTATLSSFLHSRTAISFPSCMSLRTAGLVCGPGYRWEKHPLPQRERAG